MPARPFDTFRDRVRVALGPGGGNMEPMQTLLRQMVFAAGDRDYHWADVVLGAKLWGDWAALEGEVRQGLACVNRVQEADEEPDPDQVAAAAEEFRYERDLVSAAETEAWLERWGLTAEAWMDYIERSVLRREWAAELPEIAAEYPATDDEVADAIGAEGVCSGHFSRFARKLAGRAAVCQRMQEEAGGESPVEGQEGEPPVIEAAALPGMDPGVSRQKLVALAGLECAFRRFRDRVLTPQAIRDAVGARHLDWMRLHCRSLSFPDAQMAQEAALCIREDGAELAEVGRAAKAAVREARFFLDEADPDYRHTFLSAAVGDLLGPLPINGEFLVVRVLEKILPSAEDPAVRRRAEREVLERAVDHEITNRVRWLSPL